METVTDLGCKFTVDSDYSHEIQRRLLLGKKAMTKFKSKGIALLTKVHLVKAMIFPSVMWELDNKYDWAPKNWCFQIVVLEKTLESHLDCKEVKPINPKRNQPWIFIEWTIAKAEAPILWPPEVQSQLIGKNLMLGKIEGKRRRGWKKMDILDSHHWVNRHEFEQSLGDNRGQRSLACYSSLGHKQSDMT